MSLLTKMKPADILRWATNDSRAREEVLRRLERLESAERTVEEEQALSVRLQKRLEQCESELAILSVNKTLKSIAAQHALQVLDNQKLKERLEKCEATLRLYADPCSWSAMRNFSQPKELGPQIVWICESNGADEGPDAARAALA